MFADLVGSTSLAEQLDAEAVRAIVQRYFGVAREALEEHGGTLEKFIGDAVLAVFGVPVARDDDALRAARAAIGVQDAVAALARDVEARWGVRIAVRIGISTGEVVVGDPTSRETFVTGDTVNVAARLQQQAGQGAIVVDETTAHLTAREIDFEPLGPTPVKGRAAPVIALRLIGRSTGAAPASRQTQVFGRKTEAAALRETLDASRASNATRLALVVGEAGMGKSHLVDAFIRGIGPGTTVLRGRCLSSGRGATYWPVTELMRQAAAISAADAAPVAMAKLQAVFGDDAEAAGLALRLAAAIGMHDVRFPEEELFWAIRRALEQVASKGPLVVVIDDLHAAEPTFRRLLRYIVDWSDNAAMTLVALARPEVLDVDGGLVATRDMVIRLERLVDDAINLVVSSAGDPPLDPSLVERIVRRADGNPLFAVELVLAARDPQPAGPGQPAASSLADVPLPQTTVPVAIKALMSARLDRVPRADRPLIGGASIIGESFDIPTLTSILPAHEGAGVNEAVSRLIGADVLARAPGGEQISFRHPLLRETAYETLSKADRATLHERLADRMVGAAVDRAEESDAIIGHHLEQAFRFREAVSFPSDDLADLRGRAATWLAKAGRRALDRFDMPAAIDLLRRARALTSDDDGARPDILEALADALDGAGDFAGATEAAGSALAQAIRDGDRRTEVRARLQLVAGGRLQAAPGWVADAQATGREAVAALESLGDDLGLARAWGLLATAAGWAGSSADSIVASVRSIEHGRRAGVDEAWSLKLSAILLFYGPEPAPQAIATARTILREHGHIALVRSSCHLVLGGCLGMRGRFPEARAEIDAAAALNVSMGRPFGIAGAARFGAYVESLADDFHAAERRLTPGIELMRRIDDRSWLGSLLATRGHARARIGDLSGAASDLDEARALSGDDDMEGQVTWRLASVALNVGLGRSDEAERFAREAVTVADETDDITDHADARLVLAGVLSGERSEERRRLLVEARRLYRRKGNLVGARRARAALVAEAGA